MYVFSCHFESIFNPNKLSWMFKIQSDQQFCRFLHVTIHSCKVTLASTQVTNNNTNLL